MAANPITHQNALAEVRRLVRGHAPDEASLVDALLAVRREASKLALAKMRMDESIPLADRQRIGTPLSDVERRLLEAGGLSLEPDYSADQYPEIEAQRRIAKLLIESLTVDEAASLMGVSSGTIEERAKTRKLYSLESEYGLARFPRFQFSDSGLLPGFDNVEPHIPSEASLIGLSSWFALENPDLFVDDDIDRIFSPRDWLLSGRNPAVVVQLTQYLCSID